jgi:sorting nexin-29
MEEFENAIAALKKNKSPGVDNLQAELLKYGSKELARKLYNVILQIWVKEEIPNKWNISIICPIHKKGDPLECHNYRGISLLNTAYKELSNILFRKISPYAEKAIGSYQCGFRKDRSTIDQIFSLRQIMEKTTECRVTLYHLFEDFKSAYDTVNREQLYLAMREFEIPDKLIRMIKLTMEDT